MEPLKVNKDNVFRGYTIAGLSLLLLGLLFGVVGSLQYTIPGFLRDLLSFEKIRPLHVSSVIFWIILISTGSVLFYLRESGRPISSKVAVVQLLLKITAVVAIAVAYFNGLFGGREYWEFPPVLALFILLAWLLFAVNVLRAVRSVRQQPVYIWMWLTGAIGFLFTFSESYLWLIPYFKEHVVLDMTVQWKSYGSMVGCWNMLVYGLGLYLVEKISEDKSYGRSRLAFLMFFLGFFNLLFNWSHHVYTLPISPYIKHIGYAVSMTELIILGRIIYKWRGTLSTHQKHKHHLAFRFLMAADYWIFFNVFLATLISIPAINVYTHGTHITVAHVMGATIGINSMLLLACIFDQASAPQNTTLQFRGFVSVGFWMVNVALTVFIISLLSTGVLRAYWQMDPTPIPFSELMKQSIPFFILFATAGFFLLVGFSMIGYKLLQTLIQKESKAINQTERIRIPEEKEWFA